MITLIIIVSYIFGVFSMYNFVKILNYKGPGDYFDSFTAFHYFIVFCPIVNTILGIILSIVYLVTTDK